MSGGGKEEFVFCAICTSQAQAVHPRMGLMCANRVLNLFPLAAGCSIGASFRQIPCQVPCAFVERLGDFAVGLARAALRPEGAGVAVIFTGVTSQRQSTLFAENSRKRSSHAKFPTIKARFRSPRNNCRRDKSIIPLTITHKPMNKNG